MKSPRPDPLQRYKAKRDFTATSEPAEGGQANAAAPSFVVQKHWASRLHYDFRLEIDGAMKSWAVPKGPSFDPADKRMAVHVEDHPISYNSFEGVIPPKHYGAGKVIIWDKGTWTPIGDPIKNYRDGKLKFELHGHKLHGKWTLVRMRGKSEKQDPWLLIKEQDSYARSALEYSVVDEMPDSVAKLPAQSPPSEGTTSAVNNTATRRPAARRPGGKRSPHARRNAAALPPEGALFSLGRPGGKKSPLPETLAPALATLVKAPPERTQDWLYEIKFDGYRLLTRIEGKDIRLITRNGNDWTSRLPHLSKQLARMHLPDGWYDGEIVVLNDRGMPDFQALQGAFDSVRTGGIVYYLFDLPYCDGMDLRSLPLQERRARLEALLAEADGEHGAIRYSASFEQDVQGIVASACKMGLEGIIGKRKSSVYASGRSTDWIKLKCGQRQEFVIGGYTDPQGSRQGIGSLLLGVYDARGALRYAGNVGTGFNTKLLPAIKKKLAALHTDQRPFHASTGMDGKAHWVEPELVAEVSFGQWTQGGKIRHSVFHGLRTDKPASAITKETSMPISKAERTKAGDAADAGDGKHGGAPLRTPLQSLKITHPERIVDASSGTRKIDVLRYYAVVAPLMMEHLKGRPVSLVRAPEGVQGQMFFQKHLETATMTGVRQLSPKLDPGHDPLMEIASPRGLLSAAQMNVIEFHTWNAVKTLIGKPDRMTFDLDPGKGVEWPAVQEAAMLLHAFLDELELASFIKTSGGKGLHIIVPLQRRHGWDTVKDFSHAIVRHMAATLPSRFAAKSGPRNRVGKIFIDYLRNGFGATTVSAWSIRARPGMGASVPVGWDEVETLKSSAHWHIGNIHERLDTGNQPWSGYSRAARSLTTPMKILGFKPK